MAASLYMYAGDSRSKIYPFLTGKFQGCCCIVTLTKCFHSTSVHKMFDFLCCHCSASSAVWISKGKFHLPSSQHKLTVYIKITCTGTCDFRNGCRCLAGRDTYIFRTPTFVQNMFIKGALLLLRSRFMSCLCSLEAAQSKNCILYSACLSVILIIK